MMDLPLYVQETESSCLQTLFLFKTGIHFYWGNRA